MIFAFLSIKRNQIYVILLLDITVNFHAVEFRQIVKSINLNFFDIQISIQSDLNSKTYCTVNK